jgi:hypothetical protein
MHLRGIDQIPQFSIASMKYHAHESLDWLKDIVVGMHEGGRSIGANSGFFYRSGSGVDSESGLGGGRGFSRTGTNPVSHQSQNQTHGGTASGNGGGFVRPKPRTGSELGNSKHGDINPISHQAQSRADNGESSSLPTHPAKKDSPRPNSIQVDTADSTKEEREFMLGDDEGDEGDDVGVALSKPIPTPAPQRLDPVVSSASVAPDAESGDASEMRGRDLGGGDAMRL